MKKQIKKLSLNKKTISNLNGVEMNKKIGGITGGCHYPHRTKGGGKSCDKATCFITCENTCI